MSEPHILNYNIARKKLLAGESLWTTSNFKERFQRFLDNPKATYICKYCYQLKKLKE